MKEQEMSGPGPHRMYLSKGRALPQPRPSSFVNWPAGLLTRDEQPNPPPAES